MKRFEPITGIVYGPIETRRKGRSLGINLLPRDPKVCSFDCVYCQCGWTPRERSPNELSGFPSVDMVSDAVFVAFSRLARSKTQVDVITIAGNGEPTLHPHFRECMGILRSARNSLLEGTPLRVLSAGTGIRDQRILEGLSLCDEYTLKLDAGTARTLARVNRPMVTFDIEDYTSHLERLSDVSIQSCFIGGRFDNTSDQEIEAWLERLVRVQPRKVEIYSIARTPPASGLEVVDSAKLHRIGRQVEQRGIHAQVV